MSLLSVFRYCVVYPLYLSIIGLSLVVSFLYFSPTQTIDIHGWPNQNKDISTAGIRYVSIETEPGVKLQTIEAGDPSKPLIVFLHGFPETALITFHEQIQFFSTQGYYVLAPDQRGYNESSKPEWVSDYTSDKLVNDVKSIITKYAKRDKAYAVVGHDWGAVVAWNFALTNPNLVERLVVINMGHPSAFAHILMSSFKQLRKSWYIFWFQVPVLPEIKFLSPAPGSDIPSSFRIFQKLGQKGYIGLPYAQRYKEAWSKHHALSSMINWYRAAIRTLLTDRSKVRQLEGLKSKVPTLIIWGDEDEALEKNIAQVSFDQYVDSSVKDKSKLKYFEGVSHWVTHEASDRVNTELSTFFSAK